MKTFLKRHSLIIGIVLMFLYTWTIDLSNSGVLPFQFPFAIYITLGWGFILASLLMTWLTLGRDEMMKLFKRFFIWRVGWKWYLAALLLEPVCIVAGVNLNAALTQTPADFSTVMAFAVILTWLYNNTKGSLLIVAICHAISNTVGVFMPMANTVSSENLGSYIFYVLMEAVVAIVVTVVAGPARLSRMENKQIQE